MYSWNQIQKMNKEELATENNRLAKKLIMHKIVIPLAAAAVVHVGLNYLFNKLDDTNED